MGEAVKLYTEFGYPALQKGGQDKKLIGYFQADTGMINQLVHLWKFADDADRRAHWASVFANKDFVEGFAVKFRPLVASQEVKLLTAAPGARIPDAVTRLVTTRVIVVAILAAGIVLSRPLWGTIREYPPAPWLPLPPLPDALSPWILPLLLALLALALVPRPWTPLPFIAVAAALVVWDQTRLQPWLYQGALFLGALALATGHARPASSSWSAPISGAASASSTRTSAPRCCRGP